MSDPRLGALMASYHRVIPYPVPHKVDREAARVLRAIDAADPLLPKVRALYEAVRVYHFDPVTVPALPDLPPAGARVRRAFDAFTPDDLARLGVTRAGE